MDTKEDTSAVEFISFPNHVSLEKDEEEDEEEEANKNAHANKQKKKRRTLPRPTHHDAQVTASSHSEGETMDQMVQENSNNNCIETLNANHSDSALGRIEINCFSSFDTSSRSDHPARTAATTTAATAAAPRVSRLVPLRKRRYR